MTSKGSKRVLFKNDMLKILLLLRGNYQRNYFSIRNGTAREEQTEHAIPRESVGESGVVEQVRT